MFEALNNQIRDFKILVTPCSNSVIIIIVIIIIN